jgi:hypothetical protein
VFHVYDPVLSIIKQDKKTTGNNGHCRLDEPARLVELATVSQSEMSGFDYI